MVHRHAFQPHGVRRANVPDGVRHRGGNQKFLSGSKLVNLSLHFNFDFAFNKHHELINVMSIIRPCLAGAVATSLAGEAAPVPIGINMGLVDSFTIDISSGFSHKQILSRSH